LTRKEFTDAHRHEIDGWLLDAILGNHKGAELSMFLKAQRAKIEKRLGEMYDQLCPPPVLPPNPMKAAANGAGPTGVKKP